MEIVTAVAPQQVKRIAIPNISLDDSPANDENT